MYIHGYTETSNDTELLLLYKVNENFKLEIWFFRAKKKKKMK